MKKFTFLAATFLFAANTFSQSTTVDFEGFLANPESFDNGSGGAGNFVFDDIELYNNYNTNWSSYTGFAISNTTDIATAGFANQYSSCVGQGNANSSTYSVMFSDGFIETNNTYTLESLYLNNTTYAKLSMLNGDSFSKQFGSPNGADGNPDGTNGEDFFRVLIIGENTVNTDKDTIIFYLADYRFADNNDDYIVTDWTQIDLTSMNVYPIEKVSFVFESSDMGQWGINTPTFFALDDVKYGSAWGLNEKTLEASVYPNPFQDIINVSFEGNGLISILDINGKLINSQNVNHQAKIDLSSLNKGVYFLNIEGENGKFTQKIVK